jgi:Pyruvate/2-oxoacid:ferredoxin oxidoreductase delta subunit
MGNESYERLADALDALPNGFPRMPSGVEIKLLKKAFTADEAEIASDMSRKYETASEVASRIHMPEAKVKELLDDLLSRRLIRQRVVERQEEYRLGPFIVGWWEAMMERLSDDREFAELTQQYFTEGGGERIMSPRPGILGVVPARGSLKPELLQPYDDIDAHFARYERFYVEDCVCRIGQNLLGSHCEKPVTRCAFVGLPPQTPLSEHVLDREQALKLFCELEEQGHVHLGFYGFIATAESPQFVGSCNCCGDCCGILRAVNDMNLTEGPQRSNYRGIINSADCIACGDCIERCQVHAITEGEDGFPILNRDRCIGCGLCVVSCSTEAIELVPVSAEEWFDIPSSFEEWEERRLRTLDSIKQ